MSQNESKQLVFTIPERCRTCYTCVRECPAKAIKIELGQAEVVYSRCIACGNCIRVCRRDAKWFVDARQELSNLIAKGEQVVAMIAPSFPGEFMDYDNHKQIVGMVKAIGFDKVHEVAFGADLVANEYKKLLDSTSDKKYISSDCPSIVLFIRKYHPDLVPHLAPICSPMVAMARVLKKIYDNPKLVFIGPCIAKKGESDEIDIVLTFRELRAIFEDKGITIHTQDEEEFDEPIGNLGSIFPVNRGLIQSIDIDHSINDGKVVVAEGHLNFQEALYEFQDGKLKNQHLELLCCDGCIMGAGMTSIGNRYAKSAFISNYVTNKTTQIDKKKWEKYFEQYADIDLSAHFTHSDTRMKIPSANEIKEMLEKLGKKTPADELNCGACGYHSCEEHAIAILNGLAEIEMCLPDTIDKLHTTIETLNITNEKLASAQQALKQSEKLASMGQLSAGIAHELNNPLGVVMMYSNIILDEIGEDSPLSADIKLIVEQADRCKKIVGGLLNFARKNQIKPTEINLKDFTILSVQSVVFPKNVESKINCTVKNPIAVFDQAQMMQVFTNIIKNAIDAMPQGGMITIKISEDNDYLITDISDTGSGISKEDLDKIFEPFYTTKGVGKGTGLGLAIAYGIIKMHKGKISVESNNDTSKGHTGTTFKIYIPKQNRLDV